MTYRILLVIILALTSSCKKEEIPVTWADQTLSESNTLNAIHFPSSTVGYICGGTKNVESVLLKTSDSAATWTSLNKSLPLPGSLYDIYFLDENVGFVVGHRLGVYKTIDGGTSWKEGYIEDYPRVGYHSPFRAVFFINPLVGFAAGGEDFDKGVIYKTVNGGSSWKMQVSTDFEVRDIAFSDDQKGFACGYGAILRTDDGGNTWTHCDVKGEFYTSIHMFNSSSAIIAGYNGSIIKTNDFGESWKKQVKGNKLFPKKRFHLNKMTFFDSANGIAIGENGYFLSTSNGGENWKIGTIAEKNDFQGTFLKSSKDGYAVGANGKLFSFSF